MNNPIIYITLWITIGYVWLITFTKGFYEPYSFVFACITTSIALTPMIFKEGEMK